MDANLVLKTRAAKVLLDEIEQSPTLLAQLQAFFTPYCDCDLTQWIVSRIQANDSFVIAKIRELIAPLDNFPVVRGNNLPVAGQLLSQYCIQREFIGIYANGNGGTTEKVIETDSLQCGPAPKARFYFPLEPQRAALMANQPVTFSAFHLSEPNNVDVDPYITSYKLYDPISVSGVRFKIKVGGLPDEDYPGLSVRLINPRDTEGNYFDIPDPSNTNPYNSSPNTEQVDVDYDVNNRIISIYIPYVWNRNLETYLCVMKDNKVAGWLKMTTNIFWQNQAGTIRDFKTWIINPGSDMFG